MEFGVENAEKTVDEVVGGEFKRLRVALRKASWTPVRDSMPLFFLGVQRAEGELSPERPSEQ